MADQTLLQHGPASPPAEPPVEIPMVFVDCPELAEQLDALHREQVEIDRRAAEELARLRALQDRD